MSENNLHIAAAANFTRDPDFQLWAGDFPVATVPMTILTGQGVIPQYTPLAMNAAGKLVLVAATTDKVVAVTSYAEDTSAGDVRASVYVSGYFNEASIAWGSVLTTELLRQAACANSNILFRAITAGG